MAHAYTPGLKVSEKAVIRKERKLPLWGDVLVNKGDMVNAEDVVARALLPGPVHPKNLAGELGIPPSELKNALIVKKGESIKKGQVIARAKVFFGLFKVEATSPIDGYLEDFSEITGQVILRENPIPVEVLAYLDGVVEEVIPREGVIIRTVAGLVQGIFGVGGEKIGTLKVAVDSPYEILKSDRINENLKGAIVVGGRTADIEAINKAAEVGIKALVLGSIDDGVLREFVGYDIGVAITGNENVPFTLIITEGFGDLPMAERTFNLFKKFEGLKASANGATQIRAGVQRPEVIIFRKDVDPFEEVEDKLESGYLDIGTTVRIIRDPYFGEIGTVIDLPNEPIVIETESKVRVLKVRLMDGREVVIPRANVELIET
ncbi:hypothetical protein LM594_03770 [Candidatus Caldipriscus sp.]|nr:hypothetical protein [Candidatus Caldipriscus sp.]